MGLLCRLFGHASKPYVPAGGPRDVEEGMVITSTSSNGDTKSFVQGRCSRCGERLVLARLPETRTSAMPDEVVIRMGDLFYNDPVGLIREVEDYHKVKRGIR